MNDLYNALEMPLSDNPERRIAQEKILKGEPLTMHERIEYAGGHDHPLKNIGNYKCKPDHCYRAVSRKTFEIYKECNCIIGFSEYLGEVIDENGNKRIDNGGVDWYLGGYSKRYGDIVIECPAYKEYFVPNYDHGFGLSSDLTVRHMKSSGKIKPIPLELITNVFDLSLENEDKCIYDEVMGSIKR